MDGRGAQHLLDRARHGRSADAGPAGAPIFRRLRPVGDRRHSTVARNRWESALRLSRQRRGRRSGDTHVPCWPGTATFITYNKTALWLHTLERHLGWPVLQRIMSTYFERWTFRHPQPADFFAVVNEVSGRDMTSFFDQAYRSSNVFDYGVQTFTSTRVRLPASPKSASEPGAGEGGPDDTTVRLKPDTTYDGYHATVVVRRFGEAIFPVDVVTTFRDGQRVTERWDGRDRRAIYTPTGLQRG